MGDYNRGLDPTGGEEEGYPKNGGSGGPHTQNSVKPETATRNKTDLRCRETIPNDFKTANRPKRPDTLQDLKSFLLADFSTTQTTKGTKEGRATGRPKRPC